MPQWSTSTQNLCSGKLRPSKSPYGSPLFFVKEKDGTLKVVADFGALNAITKKNNITIPRIDKILDQLGWAHYILEVDLKTCFHQVSIAPQDIERTALTTKYEQSEYVVMAMGLSNAPKASQTLVNFVFHNFIDILMVVNISDSLVFSPEETSQLKPLQIVLDRFTTNYLYVSPRKCHLMREEVAFLGLTVRKQGIEVDPKRARLIQTWRTPRSLTEARRFLGLVQIFRRFIKRCSCIERSLTDLMRKEKVLELGIGHVSCNFYL